MLDASGKRSVAGASSLKRPMAHQANERPWLAVIALTGSASPALPCNPWPPATSKRWTFLGPRPMSGQTEAWDTCWRCGCRRPARLPGWAPRRDGVRTRDELGCYGRGSGSDACPLAIRRFRGHGQRSAR